MNFILSELRMCVHTGGLCLLFLHIQRLQLIGSFSMPFSPMDIPPIQKSGSVYHWAHIYCTSCSWWEINSCVCEVERVSSDQQGAYFTVNSRKKKNVLVPLCHLLIIRNTWCQLQVMEGVVVCSKGTPLHQSALTIRPKAISSIVSALSLMQHIYSLHSSSVFL